MGSLSSRPQVPSQPQIVYIPAPVYVPSPSSPSSSPSTPAPTGSSPSTPTPEENAESNRKASLLQRSRGRFGTVQTSFRGLLDLAGNALNNRKTLLGE
jgi:hypothetical protein